MNTKYPPGPRDGRFGITFHQPMRRDPLGFAIHIAREFGDFAFARIGWVRLYFVNRPDLIRDVLVAKARSFRKLTRQMRSLRKIEGDGLVVAEGSMWARHRPVVQGSFHPRHFARYGDIVVESTRRRLDQWQIRRPFDLAAEMNELALEIIARLVFDVDLAGQARELRDAVHEFRQAMQGEGGSSIVLPDWLPLPSKRRQRRAIAKIDTLIWSLIRECQANGAAGDNMLSQILAAVAGRPDLGITDVEVRDEAATLFVAGHDTTSAALAWFWYALATNPDVEQRVLNEIDGLEDRPVEYADLPQLRYLEMVVKESMRLYPATAFLFGREAIEDVELGGCTLKRGSWVFMSPYIVQRNPDYFPDPDRFDPERFAPGRADQIPAYSYLVFGAGPRTCIGNSLATMEIVLLAATVLQRFRLRLDEQNVEPEMEVVLRPKGGLRMIAETRLAPVPV
ncbi:MAG TPA: cytochrome P450 [Gemmataceae bacterium]|nr:cytochrome P450 [Gemmataceae bacterium]